MNLGCESKTLNFQREVNELRFTLFGTLVFRLRHPTWNIQVTALAIISKTSHYLLMGRCFTFPGFIE